MSRLLVSQRRPEPGDILQHPELGRRQVVRWTQTDDAPRCGMEFVYLPEDRQDERDERGSWHCGGWSWLRAGWYVSRPDGGFVESA